jgi:quinol monooxygenase YgiN
MLTISAIIRAKNGHEATMRQALLDVVSHVRDHEPSTIGYYVSQDVADPRIFATYERYVDQAAMDRHNNSPAVARFFDVAKPIIDGDVILVSANEIASKGDLT